MEEKQAVALLKKGELSGLEYLVQRYQVQAVKTAYLIVADRSLAEQIVQAAFLKAAVKIGGFDEHRPFGPWFLRIVINAALRDQARGKRQISFEAAEALEIPPRWLVDPAPGPEDMTETAETRRAIWLALQQLAPKQRAAVVMRYYLEMPDKEISSALDWPLTAVKWSLHAARERLRKLLEPLNPNGKAAGITSPNSLRKGGKS